MSEKYHLNARRTGHGSALILIHGVAGSARIWDPIVPLLAKNYEVIRIDLLGYGHSPKPQLDYTPAQHVEAIRNTLMAAGLKPPYELVGLSMGCLLTLEYARAWPQEVRQILNIGLPYYPTAAEARHYLRRSINARIMLDWGIAGRLMIGAVWSIGKRSRTLAGLFSHFYSAGMAQESMMVSYQAFYATLMRGLVENRPGPLLDGTAAIRQSYLHGADDRYTPPSEVEKALASRKNADLTILPGVAHNTVIAAPDPTAEWIVRSLLHRPNHSAR